MHTHEEVKAYITDNLDDAIDDIQCILSLPGVCDSDCPNCWMSYLCVDQDTSAVVVTQGEDKEKEKHLQP